MRDPSARNGDDSNGRPTWRGIGREEDDTNKKRSRAAGVAWATLTLTSGVNVSWRTKRTKSQRMAEGVRTLEIDKIKAWNMFLARDSQ